MVDVAKMPANSFGSVPTPAIVSPIEFTMRLDDYRALGGHMDRVQRLEQLIASGAWRTVEGAAGNPWPLARLRGGQRVSGARAAQLGDGRWHFQHGPIDCIVFAEGESGAAAECVDRAWLALSRRARRAGRGAAAASRRPVVARRCRGLRLRGPVARRMVAACRRMRLAAASSRRWRRWPAASPRS